MMRRSRRASGVPTRSAIFGTERRSGYDIISPNIPRRPAANIPSTLGARWLSRTAGRGLAKLTTEAFDRIESDWRTSLSREFLGEPFFLSSCENRLETINPSTPPHLGTRAHYTHCLHTMQSSCRLQMMYQIRCRSVLLDSQLEDLLKTFCSSASTSGDSPRHREGRTGWQAKGMDGCHPDRPPAEYHHTHSGRLGIEGGLSQLGVSWCWFFTASSESQPENEVAVVLAADDGRSEEKEITRRKRPSPESGGTRETLAGLK